MQHVHGILGFIDELQVALELYIGCFLLNEHGDQLRHVLQHFAIEVRRFQRSRTGAENCNMAKRIFTVCGELEGALVLYAVYCRTRREQFSYL